MALFTCGFEQLRFCLVSKEWHFPCSKSRVRGIDSSVVHAATTIVGMSMLLTSVFQYENWNLEFPSNFILHL